MAATPISGPARVYSTASASRAMEESTTLEITSTLAPSAFASRMAWKVSMVSPDWLTPMTRVCPSITGFRYRNSLAMSISTGHPGPVLDGVLGHEPGVVAAAAGHHEHLVDVPELLVGDVHLVEHQRPVGQQPVEQGVGHRLGLLVHLLGHEVVVAVLLGGLEIPVDVQRRRARPVAPPRSVTEIDPGRSSATRSSSRMKKSWVRPRMAGMSEARKAAPSLTPMISGETRRAATMTSGSSACTTARAKAPRTRLSAARTAPTRPPAG